MGLKAGQTQCPPEILYNYTIPELQKFLTKKSDNSFSLFQAVNPDFVPNEHLQEVLNYVDNFLSSDTDDRLKVFITGLSGSGKTETIKAVGQVLRKHNQVPLFCSAWGKIASEIGGQTLHSLLPISYYKNSNFEKLSAKIKLTPQLFNKFKDYSAIILDEISCCSASLFYYLNLVLKVAKSSDRDFGGLHTLICGDCLQLDCVAATSLTSHSKNINSFAKKGVELYRTFDTVFVLRSNVRQNNDPEFQQMLMRFRRKEVTQFDVDRLNSRRESVLSNEQRLSFSDALRIFPRNKFTRFHNKISVEALGKKIISLAQYPSEPKLLDYEGEDIAIGAKVKIKRNYDIANRLVSGSLATVEGVIYDNSKLDFPLPSVILLKVPTYTGPTINGLLPTAPVHEYVRDYITGTCTKIYYYALAPFYASSVHVCQGLTIPRCAVYIDDNELCQGITYVALSRVSSLSSLMILDELLTLSRFQSTSFFRGFRNLLTEIRRLRISHLIFGPEPLQVDYDSDEDDAAGSISPNYSNFAKSVY